MRHLLSLTVLLVVAASAAGLLMVGNEPELQEVIIEVSTAQAPGLAAVSAELSTAEAGLAAGTVELGREQAGFAAAVPEISTTRAGLAAVVVEILVPPNLPPVAVCQDATLPLDSNGEATLDPILIDGGSYDPDGDPITLAADPTEFDCTHVGGNAVTLTVTDPHGAQDTCPATVTVVDASPPDVILGIYPDHLWPPNHSLIEISLDATISDNCEITGGVMTVESNEPDDARGGGDGHTTGDIAILYSNGDPKADSSASGESNAFVSTPFDPDDRLLLRAERLGNGARDPSGNFIGRNYTITLTVTDASGNESSSNFVVNVPHDQSAHAASCTDPNCGGT